MSVLVIGADEITPIKAVLKDNTMKTIKNQAKKRNIPIVCAKRSVSCVFSEYCKVFGLDKEFGCCKVKD